MVGREAGIPKIGPVFATPFFHSTSTTRMEGTKIYVGNIPNATKEELQQCFEKFGRIVNIWIARNPPGFGFVTFETAEAAQNAVNEGNGQLIQGASIDVQMARQREPRRRYRSRSRSRSYSRSRDYSRHRHRSRSYSRSRRSHRHYSRSRSGSRDRYSSRRDRSSDRSYRRGRSSSHSRHSPSRSASRSASPKAPETAPATTAPATTSPAPTTA